MTDKKVKAPAIPEHHEWVEFLIPIKVGFCYYKKGEKAHFHKERCAQIVEQKFGKKVK